MGSWEEFMSKHFSVRNLRPRSGARMCLQDPLEGKAWDQAHPRLCGWNERAPPDLWFSHFSFSRTPWPAPQALTLCYTAPCWPSIWPGVSMLEAWPTSQGWIQERSPHRHWKPLRAQRTGRTQNLSTKGHRHGSWLPVPWGGVQLRRATVGARGPHCLGVRADLMKLWWKHNWKPEEGDLPGGPVVKTPHFHCKGCRFKSHSGY